MVPYIDLGIVCSYISGYKNRFQNFIKYLREMGDEVCFVILFTHEVKMLELSCIYFSLLIWFPSLFTSCDYGNLRVSEFIYFMWLWYCAEKKWCVAWVTEIYKPNVEQYLLYKILTEVCKMNMISLSPLSNSTSSNLYLSLGLWELVLSMDM